jgi:hypothetical protein
LEQQQCSSAAVEHALRELRQWNIGSYIAAVEHWISSFKFIGASAVEEWSIGASGK